MKRLDSAKRALPRPLHALLLVTSLASGTAEAVSAEEAEEVLPFVAQNPFGEPESDGGFGLTNIASRDEPKTPSANSHRHADAVGFLAHPPPSDWDGVGHGAAAATEDGSGQTGRAVGTRSSLVQDGNENLMLSAQRDTLAKEQSGLHQLLAKQTLEGQHLANGLADADQRMREMTQLQRRLREALDGEAGAGKLAHEESSRQRADMQRATAASAFAADAEALANATFYGPKGVRGLRHNLTTQVQEEDKLRVAVQAADHQASPLRIKIAEAAKLVSATQRQISGVQPFVRSTLSEAEDRWRDETDHLAADNSAARAAMKRESTQTGDVERRTLVATRRLEVASAAEGILQSEIAAIQQKIKHCTWETASRAATARAALAAARGNATAGLEAEERLRQQLTTAQREVAPLRARLSSVQAVRNRALGLAQRSAGALAFLERHAGQQSGSAEWFESHVAREEELARNASAEAAMAREARGATRAILAAVNQNVSELVVRRDELSTEQKRLKASVATSQAAARRDRKEADDSFYAMQAALANERKAEIDAGNRLAEVARRQNAIERVKDRNEQRAQSASNQEGELRRDARAVGVDIESERQKQEDLRNSIGQEQAARLISEQSARDLAAEVGRLRAHLGEVQGDLGTANIALAKVSRGSAAIEEQLDALTAIHQQRGANGTALSAVGRAAGPASAPKVAAMRKAGPFKKDISEPPFAAPIVPATSQAPLQKRMERDSMRLLELLS